MAIPKLTQEEWADIQKVWETDERGGYTWVARELELPVSVPAVRKRAIKEGWTKTGNQKKPINVEKLAPKKPETRNQKPKGKPRGKKQGANPDAKPAIKRLAPKTKPPHEPSEGELQEAHEYLYGESEREAGAGSGNASHTCAPMRDPGLGDFEYGSLKQMLGKKPGERSDYREEYAVIALRFLMLGATIEDIADLIGVCNATIYTWAKGNPELAAAIDGGRNFADANVASRLYQRAMGYTHETEEIKVVGDEVVRVSTVKHYPPDPQSMKFWLINRQPDLWKERVEVVEKPSITVLDKEEMDRMYDKALQEAAERRDALQSRGERLGLTMDGEFGREDEVIIRDEWGDAD